MENTRHIGCVILASGQGRRFGSNKLLASFCGQPLLCRAFAATDTPLLTGRIVVTRWAEVQALCEASGLPVLRHTLPGRNDTIRLGLTTLLRQDPALEGCMFLLGDQPLLQRESVEALLQAFYRTKKRDICRLSFAEADGSAPVTGSPVLFARRYFDALCTLPEGKGGNVVFKAHPEAVLNVPASSRWELADADTPAALAQLEKIAQQNR